MLTYFYPGAIPPSGVNDAINSLISQLNVYIPSTYNAQSVTLFGAVGDGVTDNFAAFTAALAQAGSIWVPPGTYRTSAPIVLPFGSSISGSGVNSIIKADNNSYDVLQVNQSYTNVSGIKILNGLAGIRYIGLTAPCVQNVAKDIVIQSSTVGLVLDGGSNLNFPCYWNNFYRALVLSPSLHGIQLTKSGAGDTPNANNFHSCRVFSSGVALTGNGIFVEYGNYRNSFIDCEANVDTAASSCVRLGANASDVHLINPYTESTGSVTNIIIDSGSGALGKHFISAHTAQSAGSAIADNSGGNYVSYNSPATTTSQANLFPSLNIGYPVNVVSNTLNAPFQIHGLTSNTSNLGMFIYLNNSVGTRVSLNKSRSTTLGNQGAVVLNDDIGYVDWNASDNSHFLASAQVKASVDQSVSAGQGFVAGRLSFLTSPQNSGGLVEAMRIDSNQNVIHGTAALGTTATNGFTYIATCAGAPTGVPTAYTGRVPMVFDTTNNKFWFYTSGAWKGVVVS